MSKPYRLFSALNLILTFSCVFLVIAEQAPDRILGRWERPGGASPMLFSKDGSCEVGLGTANDERWTMIKGTYKLSDTGKISLEAKGRGVTLTGSYFFEGDKLTDGVVYFGEGKRYWSKVKATGSKPDKTR